MRKVIKDRLARTRPPVSPSFRHYVDLGGSTVGSSGRKRCRTEDLRPGASVEAVSTARTPSEAQSCRAVTRYVDPQNGGTTSRAAHSDNNWVTIPSNSPPPPASGRGFGDRLCLPDVLCVTTSANVDVAVTRSSAKSFTRSADSSGLRPPGPGPPGSPRPARRRPPGRPDRPRPADPSSGRRTARSRRPARTAPRRPGSAPSCRRA